MPHGTQRQYPVATLIYPATTNACFNHLAQVGYCILAAVNKRLHITINLIGGISILPMNKLTQ